MVGVEEERDRWGGGQGGRRAVTSEGATSYPGSRPESTTYPILLVWPNHSFDHLTAIVTLSRVPLLCCQPAKGQRRLATVHQELKDYLTYSGIRTLQLRQGFPFVKARRSSSRHVSESIGPRCTTKSLKYPVDSFGA